MCDRASRLWLARRPDASSVWVSAAVPRGARARPPPWGAGSRGARGETLLWLISDDNFNPLQRNILLLFELAP